MKHVLAILPLLAATAAAQDDLYKSLALGDRLHVTFRSGGTLIGTLVSPPQAGTAASRQTAKKKAVDVRAAGAPFTLHLFLKRADAASDYLEPSILQWLKARPEGTLSKMYSDDKAFPDLSKQYRLAALPAVVIKDSATEASQSFLGLQSTERLDAGLARMRAKAEEAKIDFSQEDYLTLDVSLEYPGVNGTMSLARKDIKDIRKLQKMDEATRKRLEEEYKKIRESQAADEGARREAEAKKSQDAKSEIENAEKAEIEAKAKADEAKALEDKAAKLKSHDELLKQFPPDQWNDERKQTILNKSQAKLPISTEERAFLEKQAEWSEAVKAKKDKEAKDKAEQEKGATEEKK